MGRKYNYKRLGCLSDSWRMDSNDWASTKWWNSLSIEDKVKARDKYEEQRKFHFLQKRNHFYSMADTNNFRVGQLTHELINRIYVFKDYDLNYFK